MSQKKFAPTKAAAWNRGPYEIDLPSGNKMLAHRPNIYVWHKTGQIPDDVWATLLATAKGEDVSVEARWDAVSQTEICQKWWASMRDLMPSNPDNSPESRDLREVFHLA